MNVEIGTEAAQLPEKEYTNGIFVVVCVSATLTLLNFPHRYLLLSSFFCSLSTVWPFLNLSRINRFGPIWPKKFVFAGKHVLESFFSSYPKDTHSTFPEVPDILKPEFQSLNLAAKPLAG